MIKKYVLPYYFIPLCLAINLINVVQAQDFSQIIWGTAKSAPIGNSEGQGVMLNNKLYMFGGFDKNKPCCTPTDRVYVFEPISNVWTALAPMPAMNGTSKGGVTHAGFTTDGINIFFAGGYTSNSAGTGQIFGTKEVWRYNVAQNNYTKLPNLPIDRAAGQLEFLNGRLHFIGGTNKARTLDVGDHYVLDLSNLTAGWNTLASLPNPRHHAGSAVFNGKIYVLGGQHYHDAQLVSQTDVHEYNPLTNTWQKMTGMGVGLNHISSSTFVFQNRILVLGGQTKHLTHSNQVSAFNPLTNTWQTLTSLPKALSSGVSRAINGKIYYATGNRLTDNYVGTPVINSDNQAPTAPQLSLGTITSNSITLNWTGASDNVGVTAYQIYNGLNLVATTVNTNFTVSGLNANTSYSFNVKALDGVGNVSVASNVVSTTTLNIPPTAIRINTGGSAQTVDGVTWQGCAISSNCNAYVSGGGFAYTKANTITGFSTPMNQTILQTEWTGGAKGGTPVAVGAVAFSYKIPVNNGNYLIRLHFVELVQNSVGLRTFDVNIEGGAKELIDFDIFQQAGGLNKAIFRDFAFNISDGNINIDFIRKIENAKISAIEIISQNIGNQILNKTSENTLKEVTSLYPNPITSENLLLNFSEDLSNEEEVNYQIVNTMGKILKDNQHLTQMNKHKHESSLEKCDEPDSDAKDRVIISVDFLPAGVYYLRINGKGIKSRTMKFIKN